MRVLLPMVLLLLSVVVVVSVWLQMRSRQEQLITRNNENEMRVLLLQLQNSLRFAASMSESSNGLQRLVSATASDPKVTSAHLFNSNGTVLAATRVADLGRTWDAVDGHATAFELQRASKSLVIRHAKHGGRHQVIGVASIHLVPGIRAKQASQDGRLEMIRDYSHDRAQGMAAADEAFKDLILRVTILLGFVALFLHLRVTTRLRRVVHAARQFGRGQDVETILVSGSDEVASLARELETMAKDRISLEAQLRQSQKMESIGLLAGGIAHDFNNLLTIIIAGSELATRMATHEGVLENLKDIASSADRATALTGQLLAFSRRQALEMTNINLNELCENTCTMLERLVGDDVEIVRELDEACDFVKGDAEQLSQVLVNLAVNARDAMPSGGSITVSTKTLKVGASKAGTLDLESGAYVRLSVRDEGTGMDAETAARAFDPFFTTKEKGKGTGLGLSTTYGIVRQVGGAIEIESELGKGTTFHIYLPRVFGVSALASSASMSTEAHPALPATTDATILLVEDEPDVRKISVRILSEAGYEVLSAENYDEAIEHFENHKTRISLLLTDVVLVGKGGPEIAARLLGQNAELKVLYMSGYTDGALDVSGKVPDDVALLRKPFRPRGLIERVTSRLADNG